MPQPQSISQQEKASPTQPEDESYMTTCPTTVLRDASIEDMPITADDTFEVSTGSLVAHLAVKYRP